MVAANQIAKVLTESDTWSNTTPPSGLVPVVPVSADASATVTAASWRLSSFAYSTLSEVVGMIVTRFGTRIGRVRAPSMMPRQSGRTRSPAEVSAEVTIVRRRRSTGTGSLIHAPWDALGPPPGNRAMSERYVLEVTSSAPMPPALTRIGSVPCLAYRIAGLPSPPRSASASWVRNSSRNCGSATRSDASRRRRVFLDAHGCLPCRGDVLRPRLWEDSQRPGGPSPWTGGPLGRWRNARAMDRWTGFYGWTQGPKSFVADCFAVCTARGLPPRLPQHPDEHRLRQER